jgi:hypothetical protein
MAPCCCFIAPSEPFLIERANIVSYFFEKSMGNFRKIFGIISGTGAYQKEAASGLT